MKRQYKKIYVISKAFLFLCISGVVFSNISQQACLDVEVKEEVTLETVTVHFGLEKHLLKGMNLHIKRTGCRISPIGCGNGLPVGRIFIPGTYTLMSDAGNIDTIFYTDTVEFYGCRPPAQLLWKKRRGHFTTYLDSAALQRFSDTIALIDEATMRRWYPPPPRRDDTTLARLKKVNAHCADSPQYVEELTLRTATVYIVWNLESAICTDTLVVEDINIPFERGCNVIIPWDCGERVGVTRTWIIPLPDNAGTIISDCNTNWHKGSDIYSVSFDGGDSSSAWRRLETIVKSFTKSPASCLHRLKQ